MKTNLLNYYKKILINEKNRISCLVDKIGKSSFQRNNKESDVINSFASLEDNSKNYYDKEIDLSISDREQEVLYQIDQALTKIEDGTYGICEFFGTPIPIERINAVPWVSTCKKAAEIIENEKNNLKYLR